MANQAKFILVLGIIFGVLIFNLSQNFQNMALQDRFKHEVKQSKITLDSELESNKKVLEGIGSLFKATQEVTRKEFNIFVEPLLKDNKFIQALEWIPRVPYSLRPVLEEQVKRDGFPDFQIKERQSQGEMVSARKRTEYYPVLYMQPLEGNKAALGFDLASSSTRLQSLNEAIDSGKPVATSKITLVQEKGKQAGFLIFFPLYQTHNVPATLEERRKKIEGFTLGVYRIGDMIREIIDSHFIEEINLVIFEGEKLDPKSLLFGNLLKNNLFQIQEPIMVAGKTWTLVWQAKKSFKKFSSNFSILVGSSTFFIFALLAIIFHMNHSKTKKVEMEVVERTKELALKNDELETFTYRTSHDLRAPLVNIRGLSNIMKEDLEDGDYKEVSANIQKIGALSSKLENLVGDIVDVAKIDGENENFEDVDIANEVESIKENLNILIDENQVAVELSLNGNKTVWTQRKLIQRVLENLISNAIKYSDPEKPERYVRVAVSEKNKDTQIQVSDNGLGIPEEYFGEVFGMFKRFHKSSSFGSGLGLYLVKKNLEKINGKISLESNPEGTIFTIFLPASLPTTVKI
jgi:signal transduction histidine kinase